MQKIFLVLAGLFAMAVKAQENMHPSPPQSSAVLVRNGLIHIGNGQVIERGYILFENGKISSIGPGDTQAPAGAQVVDATGKQVYPGIIAPSTNLGLVEVGAVRASADFNELGDFNPSIRSLVAYNTDSKVINTLRSNGILLANIVPQGGTISGSSSVVQLDAWNWEDAAYKMDNGIHLNMPALINRPNQFRRRGSDQVDLVKQGME